MWMKEQEANWEEENEDIIDVFAGHEKILVYGFYTQLKLHNNYCSTMQNRYRSLSSTWLIAAFAGMGFLLSGHGNVELPFSSLLGVVLLCFCSGFGITLLWFLDVVLFQRLWLGTLVELATLEEAHDWLPRISLKAILMRNSKKYRICQSYFYIGINAVLLIIAAVTSAYVFSYSTLIVFLVGGVYVTGFLLMAYCMLKYGGENEKITTKSFLHKKVQ